jgi:hypothetical protein
MSMSRVAVYSLVALLASAESILAQTVQLPTFNFFGVSTTVSVPDHGTAVMGGNTTSFSGSNSRGLPLLGPTTGPLFNNRGIANGGTASRFSVTAQIHDMDTMDRALLGGMSADEFRQQVRNNTPPARVAGAAAVPQLPGDPNLGPIRGIGHFPGFTCVLRDCPPTPEEIAARDKRQQQAEEQLSMGQAMAARGKVSLAQSYYRMALNNANGDLRNKVLQAQAELSNTAATPAISAAERK